MIKEHREELKNRSVKEEENIELHILFNELRHIRENVKKNKFSKRKKELTI